MYFYCFVIRTKYARKLCSTKRHCNCASVVQCAMCITQCACLTQKRYSYMNIITAYFNSSLYKKDVYTYIIHSHRMLGEFLSHCSQITSNASKSCSKCMYYIACAVVTLLLYTLFATSFMGKQYKCLRRRMRPVNLFSCRAAANQTSKYPRLVSRQIKIWVTRLLGCLQNFRRLKLRA